MLEWVLNMKASSFLNKIRYHFDANNNTVIQQLNFCIFSYMCQMLSQQHKPYFYGKLFCFFIFKVYIQQNQIWDTLPTSKIELFATIVICKVMFCRLTILYIQYYPMSVFICTTLLLVPFHFRCFNLQASEMVLFTAITISDAVFYWAMALHEQFLPMNFVSVGS